MIFARGNGRGHWSRRHLVATLVMIAVGMGATYPAWLSILRIAIDRGQLRHLVLVPVVIAWLSWVRRRRLKLCEPGGTWVGPLILCVGWAISAAGDYANLEAIWHLGAVGVVVGCAVSVLGVDVLRAFMPAFVALLFLVPLPYRIEEQLARPFADLATAMVQAVLGFGDIGWREGASAAICAVLLGYAFAFSMPYRWWVRLLVIGVSPLAAVVGLILQIILYHELAVGTQTEQAATWEAAGGWLLIPLTLVLLIGLTRLLRWAALPLQHYKLADEA